MKHSFRDRSLRNPLLLPHNSAQFSLTGPAIDYRTLLEGSLDIICLVNVTAGHPHFIYASPSVADVLGWTVEEFLTLTPHNVYTLEALAVISEDIAKLSRGIACSTVETEAFRSDGARIWMENKVRVLDLRGPGEMTVMVSMRDVTVRKNLEDRLAHLALIDGLTGIDNRRSFDNAFDREWNLSMRTGAPLSLIMLDIDWFKLFNDKYGHQVGDDCLRAVALAVHSIPQRPSDLVARYGGEEFVVLLPDTDSNGANAIAHRIRMAAEALHIPHEDNLDAVGVITVSCGVSTALPRLGGTITTQKGLLLAADDALYSAKRQGRNRVASSILLATPRHFLR